MVRVIKVVSAPSLRAERSNRKVSPLPSGEGRVRGDKNFLPRALRGRLGGGGTKPLVILSAAKDLARLALKISPLPSGEGRVRGKHSKRCLLARRLLAGLSFAVGCLEAVS